MAESIREFLVSFGYGVDSSSQQKAEAAMKSAEDRVTASNAACLAKRVAQENKAQADRIAAALAAGKDLSQADRRFVAEQEKRRNDAAADERRRHDEAKKLDKERLEDGYKRAQAQALRLTTLAIKTVAAFDAARLVDRFTVGAFSKLDAASKQFEKLQYLATNTGGSVNGINAIVYALSQLGTSVEDAESSFQSFGNNLQKYKAFEDILKSMGIATRDMNGNLRDSSQLFQEYLTKLASMPRAQREAIAGGWGISEATVQAGTRPGLAGYVNQYNRDRIAVGSDNDASARSGTAFAQMMRRINQIIEDIRSRIADVLFRTVTPQLDAIAGWLKENGKTVSDVISSLASGVEKLGASIIRAIAGNDSVKDAMSAISGALVQFGEYIGSDKFKADIKGFVSDVMQLARSVRWALEKLGILSPRAQDPVVPEPRGDHDPSFAPTAFGGAESSSGGLGGSGRHRTGVVSPGASLGDRTHVAPGGKVGDLSKNPYATRENADAIKAAAKELGTTPEDLATVIGYETGGTFSPNKWGGAGGRYMGLIQFGPNERVQYGAHEGQSFKDQMGAVVRYLKGRGFKPGMGLLDLYSTINAGSPGHYNASDGNGTVTSHVAKMQGGTAALARAFLARGDAEGQPTAAAPSPAGTSATAIGDQEAFAAQQRIINGSRDPKDREIVERHRKQQNTPPAASTQQHAPVKVDVTDSSATKIAKAQSEPTEAHRHLENLRLVQRAMRGMLHPMLHGSSITPEQAARRSYYNQHFKHGDTKSSSVIHNPTFNVYAADAKSGLAAAHMTADRGNRELIRNMVSMES